MNAAVIAAAIQDLIQGGDIDLLCDLGLEKARTTSFNAAGLLTSDQGLVLHLEDGAEFEIRVVQSRWGSGS